MSHSRRISVSSTNATNPADLLSLINLARNSSDLANLCSTSVTEIPGEKIFEVDADISVDATCEVLIEKNVSCLTVRLNEAGERSTIGLFDYADVNAFLSLAATSHLISEDDIDVDERIIRILDAARNGKVPVKLCTDLSEKNPLIIISQSDSVVTLLARFSKGVHRVLVRESTSVISDSNLLEWFVRQAHRIEVVGQILEQSVSELKLGSERVVSCFSTETVLDAMKTMSEQGLSSVAVTDMGTGDLLSTVTVTDITRIVSPSQNNKILTTPLSQFITLIKAPDGFRDGVDKYPVYSVLPSSTLSHVIQKLLATNSHRVFITDDVQDSVSISSNGNLRGVISVLDVLSFFARLVGIPDVDPTRMQRNRTASSASSNSSSRSRSASLSSSQISRRPSSRLGATPSGAAEHPKVAGGRVIVSSLMSPIVCPPLGDSIPSALPHAISVSLPTWKDAVGYEEGQKRVIDAMKTGYPRFFIHKDIQRLAAIYEAKFGLPNENCLLFPKEYIANAFRDFMNAHRSEEKKGMNVRVVQLLLNDEDTPSTTSLTKEKQILLFIALFPSDLFPLAKQFWQHTGLGISSRMAERCLGLLESTKTTTTTESSSVRPMSPSRMTFSPRNQRYAANRLSHSNNIYYSEGGPVPSSIQDSGDHSVYVEERYGRNMPVSAAVDAKRTLRRRIAGVLAQDDEEESFFDNQILHPSLRGENVTENDVYLFPSGMSAIWFAHQLCLSALELGKSVCFGFPYTDTLKILQKWGPGCHFYGNGTDADLDELEKLLKSNSEPRIMALFCEFPSNPLLRSPNLQRMRKLADEHNFVIVVDETIGNFVNVRILPYADIVVSSLTKIFSGDCNVMGGSLILSPSSRYYEKLKSKMNQTYQDSYWDEDAIYLERNSRNFIKRILDVNKNAEAVCDFLHSQTLVENSVVKQVYYPKWETRENYDICRLPPRPVNQGNFGGLFSVTFISKEVAETFFDALPCAKGPSLGTNFTLACPYTILAHFLELPWAAQYGVEEGLIRVSVGLEDTETLLDWFRTALNEAKAST